MPGASSDREILESDEKLASWCRITHFMSANIKENGDMNLQD